jgi:hypothetical protein
MQRDRQFLIARGVFGLAGAILVALVVFVVVKAGGSSAPASAGGPVLVQPSADLQAAESTVAPPTSEPPSPSLPTSPSASVSTSTSPSPSKSSASPKPSKSSRSPKPSTSRTTTPPASISLAATCSINSWGTGFIAGAEVTNKGSQARNFTVTLAFSTSVKITGGPWNARAATASGTKIVIASNAALGGGGGNTRIGFQGEKTGRSSDDVKLTGCSVAAAAG